MRLQIISSLLLCSCFLYATSTSALKEFTDKDVEEKIEDDEISKEKVRTEESSETSLSLETTEFPELSPELLLTTLSDNDTVMELNDLLEKNLAPPPPNAPPPPYAPPPPNAPPSPYLPPPLYAPPSPYVPSYIPPYVPRYATPPPYATPLPYAPPRSYAHLLADLCPPLEPTCPTFLHYFSQLPPNLCSSAVFLKVQVLEVTTDSYGQVCGKFGLLTEPGKAHKNVRRLFRKVLRFSIKESCGSLLKASVNYILVSRLSAFYREGALFSKVSISDRLQILPVDSGVDPEILYRNRYCPPSVYLPSLPTYKPPPSPPTYKPPPLPTYKPPSPPPEYERPPPPTACHWG